MPFPLLIRSVCFSVRQWPDGSGQARELLPHVDNVSLVDLVSGYERAAGFDVSGAYAGVVLDHFNVGDLAAYLTGQPEPAYSPDKEASALLGCDCGEVGCWPLEAKGLIGDDLVTWRLRSALQATTRLRNLRSVRVPPDSV